MDASGSHSAGSGTDDGRLVRGDSRRAAILAAATREFGRRGYEGARIADIARQAGVTDAGLLHHFGTKKALFLAVVELREQVYAPMIGQLPNVRALFDGMIASVRRAEATPDLVQFRTMLTGATGVQGHPVEGRARRNLEAALGALEPFIRGAIDSGELRPDTDPRQVALEMLALNDGIRNQWVAWPEGVHYADTFAAAANSLYARIATVPDSGPEAC